MALHVISYRKVLPAFAFVMLSSLVAEAQEQKLEFPQASQRHSFKQKVGLTDVEVDYSRPNKNNREIFGGLVPYGKVWRTGANQTTKIKFNNPIKLGDKDIPAGEYVLFTIPNANEWMVIVYKDTKVQSAGEYKQEHDQARITAKPSKSGTAMESFTIELTDVKGAAANLNFAWDTTRVTVPLTTSDLEKLETQLTALAKSTAAPEPRVAFQAANYYYDNNKDLNQAAKWVDQALEKNPDAWFMHFRRAQIQQKMGNKKEATASAQKTVDFLKKEKAPDEEALKNAQDIIDKSK